MDNHLKIIIFIAIVDNNQFPITSKSTFSNWVLPLGLLVFQPCFASGSGSKNHKVTVCIKPVLQRFKRFFAIKMQKENTT